MKDLEHSIQAALILRVELELVSRYPEAALLYAIPNGGHRHVSVAVRMKAEGVRPGVPDLCLPVARGGYFGLYIEMKAPGGRVRPEQSRWHKDVREHGYFVAVLFSDDDAIVMLEEYLSWAPTGGAKRKRGRS